MPVLLKPLVPCDVCRLLEGDTSIKDCNYCGLCSSWICADCQPNWIRRARAAVKRKLEPSFTGDPNYKTGLEEADKQAGL